MSGWKKNPNLCVMLEQEISGRQHCRVICPKKKKKEEEEEEVG